MLPRNNQERGAAPFHSLSDVRTTYISHVRGILSPAVIATGAVYLPAEGDESGGGRRESPRGLAAAVPRAKVLLQQTGDAQLVLMGGGAVLQTTGGGGGGGDVLAVGDKQQHQVQQAEGGVILHPAAHLQDGDHLHMCTYTVVVHIVQCT